MDKLVCPNCGSEKVVEVTAHSDDTSKYQRLLCTMCPHEWLHDIYKQQKASINYIGHWKTTCGVKAVVLKVDAHSGFNLGVLLTTAGPIPSYWDRDGNSAHKKFNLAERDRKYELEKGFTAPVAEDYLEASSSTSSAQ
jgi:hypothetical protein